MKFELVGLLDRLLPAAVLTQGEQTQLIKARILVFISLMYLLSLASMVVAFTLLGLLGIFSLWSAVLSSTVSCCLYVGQLWYFKRSADLFRAANLGMFTMVTATTACTCLSGGWNSPVAMILLCTPAFAFLMEGQRTGLLWSAIVSAIFTELLLLHSRGITLPQLIDPALQDYLGYFSWLYGFIIVAAGMALYGNINESLNRAANLERQQLNEKATYDALTGSYYRHAFQQRLPAWIDDSRQREQSLLFFELMTETTDTVRRETMENWLVGCANILRARFGDTLQLSRSSGACFQGVILAIESDDQARAQLQLMHQALSGSRAALPGLGDARIAIGAVMVPDYSDSVPQILQTARAALQQARTEGAPYLLQTQHERPDRQRQRATSLHFVRVRYSELLSA